MNTKYLAVLALAATMTAGCDSTTSPDSEAQLAAVAPQGGAIGVDVGSKVTITFTHAMMAGMEQYAVLHEGNLQGPQVAGVWAWSSGYTTLTFTPATSLKSQTTYVIHVGGNMRDANGHRVGFDQHGPHMNGQAVGGTMMGGGSMGGGMTGSGWQSASGTYGMIFVFTTRNT